MLKLTRLDALLNSGSLKRVKFTTTKVFVYFVVLVAVSIFLLLLQTFVGQPYKELLGTTSNNQTTYEIKCSFRNSSIEILIFVLEFLMVVNGARLCLALKNAPGKFQPTKRHTFTMLIGADPFPP